ncbi:hypothetical protein ACFL6I_03180 [candidate division KSB1 bacterium]
MRRAVIDIGTNSVLLLIAETGQKGAVTAIRDDAVITRLGEGIDENGAIGRLAFDRTMDAVVDYVKVCDQEGVGELTLLGTEVFRSAVNTPEILERFLEKTGHPLIVISAKDEARLSFLSVAGDIPPGDAIMALDIGGGSTEIAIGNADAVSLTRSMPVGAVSLTERFLDRDPVSEENVAELKNTLDGHLKALPGVTENFHAVGIGGTITTVAALVKKMRRYDPEVIDGLRLSIRDIEDLEVLLLDTPVSERSKLPGMEPGRADIIAAGVAILSGVLNHFHLETIRVSIRGIRYGYMVEHPAERNYY